MPEQDGVLEVAGETSADMCDDIATSSLEESMDAHTALMFESRSNGMSSHSIVRHSAARKFNQEDPIEAAAAEMILKFKV